MTAVTTAGLLAGLFGSAFVPAVNAASGGPGDELYGVTCGTTGLDYDNGAVTVAGEDTKVTGAKCYYISTANPVVTIDIAEIDADITNGDYVFTVAGTTIKSASATSTGTGADTINSRIINLSTNKTLTVNFDSANDDNALAVVITLDKFAAGGSATIAVTSPSSTNDSATSVNDGTLYVYSLASYKKNTAYAATGFSGGANDAGDSGLSANTAATELQMGYNEVGSITITTENEYGNALTVHGLMTATLTGSLASYVGVFINDGDDCDAGDIDGIDASWTVVEDGTDNVCLKAYDSTDIATAGVGTLTVKVGTVTVYTKTIRVFGDATSVSVAQTVTRLAIGANGHIDSNATSGFAKLTYKDAAGQTLPAAGNSLDAIDDEVVLTDEDDVTIGVAKMDVGDTDNNYDDDGDVDPADGYISVDDDFCAAEDAGETLSVTGTYTNLNDDDLTFSLSVACTDGAVISNVKAAAANAAPGAYVKVLATVRDEDGNAAGFGAEVDLADASVLTLQPATGDPGDTELGDNGGAALTVADFEGADWTWNATGEWYIKVKTPTTKGNYAMVLEYDDIGDGETEGSWTVRITSSNVADAPTSQTLAAGRKKLTATANFGASAANGKVAFTLERSNGTVKTYYRKANADGVAKFTLRFRGTYEVTASFGDYITDTVILKK